MKIIYTGGEETVCNTNEYALCLGMFDGVHIGHRYLIEKTAEAAAKRGLTAGAVTFIGSGMRNRIYLLEQQAEIFEECGTDTLFVIRFDERFKNTSPEDFIDKYLCGYMKAKHIVCGSDFTFGKNKAGDVAMIRSLSEKYGYSYDIYEKITLGGKCVSSTYIRELLKEGMVREANGCLGEAFHIDGCVCEGFGIGRTIGFPTVNLDISGAVCDIKNGVYESTVSIDGNEYPGVTNIGTAPTVGGGKGKLCETYIIGADGNLYNKYVSVSLIDFLREERKFDNINDLKNAINGNLSQVCERRGVFSEKI